MAYLYIYTHIIKNTHTHIHTHIYIHTFIPYDIIWYPGCPSICFSLRAQEPNSEFEGHVNLWAEINHEGHDCYVHQAFWHKDSSWPLVGYTSSAKSAVRFSWCSGRISATRRVLTGEGICQNQSSGSWSSSCFTLSDSQCTSTRWSPKKLAQKRT